MSIEHGTKLLEATLLLPGDREEVLKLDIEEHCLYVAGRLAYNIKDPNKVNVFIDAMTSPDEPAELDFGSGKDATKRRVGFANSVRAVNASIKPLVRCSLAEPFRFNNNEGENSFTLVLDWSNVASSVSKRLSHSNKDVSLYAEPNTSIETRAKQQEILRTIRYYCDAPISVKSIQDILASKGLAVQETDVLSAVSLYNSTKDPSRRKTITTRTNSDGIFIQWVATTY